jgi:hypothetical protein
MKSKYVRFVVAAAIALGLAACGGKAQFDIQGTVENLKYGGLVLTSNGQTVSVPANTTTFKFGSGIDYGTTYNVKVQTQPAHQNCVVANPTDTAGRMQAINVFVSCSMNSYAIGGTVSGLTTEGLVLINGSNDTFAVSKGATSYTFFNQVEYGVTYGVTILKQPTGLRCTVANPTGTMGEAAVTNINVACEPSLGG